MAGDGLGIDRSMALLFSVERSKFTSIILDPFLEYPNGRDSSALRPVPERFAT
jgi:hypothetical protein